MHALVANDNVIRNRSAGDKGTLERINDAVQSTFKSIGYSPRYDLVANIAETDWPEVFDGQRFFYLRDERDNSLILVIKGGPIIEHIKSGTRNLPFHNIPGVLKEEGCEPVWARRFGGMKIKHGLFHLFFRERGI